MPRPTNNSNPGPFPSLDEISAILRNFGEELDAEYEREESFYANLSTEATRGSISGVFHSAHESPSSSPLSSVPSYIVVDPENVPLPPSRPVTPQSQPQPVPAPVPLPQQPATLQTTVTAPQAPARSSAMSNIGTMPLRDERGVPRWGGSDDDRDEAELYFDELERTMDSRKIPADQRKKAALLYVPLKVAKRWRAMPTYRDPAQTYEKFKEEVLKLYVGADANHVYTRAEYQEFVKASKEKPVSSLAEYMSFYTDFYPMAQFLMTQKPNPRLTLDDAAEDLLSLVPEAYLPMIYMRLEQRNPGQHTDDPYALSEIHESIQHALAATKGFRGGARSEPSVRSATPTGSVSAIVPEGLVPKTELRPETVEVKSEVFSTAIESMMKRVLDQHLSAMSINVNRDPPPHFGRGGYGNGGGPPNPDGYGNQGGFQNLRGANFGAGT